MKRELVGGALIRLPGTDGVLYKHGEEECEGEGEGKDGRIGLDWIELNWEREGEREG